MGGRGPFNPCTPFWGRTGQWPPGHAAPLLGLLRPPSVVRDRLSHHCHWWWPAWRARKILLSFSLLTNLEKTKIIFLAACDFLKQIFKQEQHHKQFFSCLMKNQVGSFCLRRPQSLLTKRTQKLSYSKRKNPRVNEEQKKKKFTLFTHAILKTSNIWYGSSFQPTDSQ